MEKRIPLWERLLSRMFPVRQPSALKPADIPWVMGYQYRLSRTVGIEPCGSITQAKAGKVVEGEYIRPIPSKSELRYTEQERPKVAVFPMRKPDAALISAN